MIDFIWNILISEFFLTVYGVILFHIEDCMEQKLNHKESIKKVKSGVISSLIWVGLVIAFDDELLARYNEMAHVDYSNPPFFMYIIGGFLVDFFRAKFKKMKESNLEI